MRVAILGAGAIGSLVGAALYRGGAEVSVIARGANLEAILKDGLHISGDAESWNFRPRVSDKPEELGTQDLVVVAVKAPALPAIAASIGPLLEAGTSVAFLMNGVPWWYFHRHGGLNDNRRLPMIDPDGALWHSVGPHRVIGGVVRCAAFVESPGHVRVTSAVRRITLGRTDDSRDSDIETLQALMISGGLEASLAPNIRDAVWDKLVGNLMDGPVALLTGARSDVIFADGAIRTIAGAIGREVIAIGEAMGRTTSVDIEQTIEAGSQRKHLPSIAEDFQRKRLMEIDALMTMPLAFAAEHHVDTPMLDVLVALSKMRAQSSGLYRPSSSA